MGLHDIKYVMSVDDKAATSAVSKFANNLKALDGKKFGGGDLFGKNMAGAADGAKSTFATLGESLGQVLGGPAFGRAVGEAIGKSGGLITEAAASTFGNLAAPVAISFSGVLMKHLRRTKPKASDILPDAADSQNVGEAAAEAASIGLERVFKIRLPQIKTMLGAFFKSWSLVGAASVIAIGAAFAAVAMHANKAWSEVEDGVMRVSASLVSFGDTVEHAFGEQVTEKILATSRTLAVGFGAMPADVAAATAVLTKNGMELDAALSRMSMVQNIATVNKMSMAEAANTVIAAWNGEAKALKAIGIRFADTGDAAQNAQIGMKKMQEQYGKLSMAGPFISDEPFAAAAAAVNLLWVELGKALDPGVTAAAQVLADIIIGIAESIQGMGSSDFVPNVMGLLAGIGETVRIVINAAVVVGNVFQMLWTGTKMFGQAIWAGILKTVAYLENKIGYMLEKLGEAIDYLPGSGDAGKNIAAWGKGMKDEGWSMGQEVGKGFAESAQANLDALKKDWADIGNAVGPDGGAVGALQRKGKEARERAQAEAQKKADAAAPLPESEKIREEREKKQREEAERLEKKRQQEEKQTFERNKRLDEERARYAKEGSKISISLSAPQRMIPAIRHSAGRR